MERAAFLVERTGERIPCLLNPDSVVARRYAGVRSAGAPGSRITSPELTDDPLIFTGGGRTEYELDLLFDTSLLPGPATVVQAPPASLPLSPAPAGSDAAAGGGPAGPAGAAGQGAAGQGAAGQGAAPLVPSPTPPTAPPIDVRTLTAPLWRLAENNGSSSAFGVPELVTLVWGKSWMVLGVITAIAERVEQFDADGTPGRSWMSLRMIRVPEAISAPEQPAPDPAAVAAAADATPTTPADAASAIAHEVLGDGSTGPDGVPAHGERLDAIAARYYPGQPWMWMYLAMVNGIEDPPFAPAGAVLQIPPAPDIDDDATNAGSAP